MKRKRKEAQPDRVEMSNRWSVCLIGFCGLLILVRFIAGFFPHLRIWGINHLAYFPLHTRIIVLLLSLSVFIPQVNRSIRAVARRCLLFLWEQAFKRKPYAWFVVFSLLAVIGFWVFRSRTYLLGDGFNYVTNLDRGVGIWIWSELLESLLYVHFHRLLNLFWSVDGHLTYQLGSIAAGAIFIFLAFLFSDYLGRDSFEKVFVWVILTTIGSAQLFFGYTEHYSFVSLAVLGYILSSLRWLEKKRNIFLPVFLFFLAIAFHFSGFLLLPSLVYLLLLSGPRRITSKKLLFVGGGAILAVVLISAYVYTSKPLLIRIFVLPVEGKFTSGGYTSFSSAHLLDVLNELLLISTAGAILILSTVLCAFKRVYLKSTGIIFLMLMAGSGFVFHFTFDPLLGAPRDWDMFAITSLGYTILGICLFLKIGLKTELLKYASLVLICTSVFSLLPWIALNANEPNSVRRFQDVLELDPDKSKSGRFFLTTYFGRKGMLKEYEEASLRQFETYPHLYLAGRAMEYFNKGMPDTAWHLLRKACRMDPLSSEVHYHMGRLHHLEGNLDSAEAEYRQALELKPENVYAGMELALVYAEQQLLDEALSQYKTVLKFKKDDPEIYYNVGIIYLRQERPQEAVEYLRKATYMKEDYVQARSRLALALSKTGRPDEAIEEFEKTIKLEPDLAMAYGYLGYLYRDKGQTSKAKSYWKQFLRLSTDSSQSEVIRNALEGLGDS